MTEQLTSAAYYTQIWQKAKTELEASLSAENFDNWFKNVECLGGNNDTLILSTPSQIATFWLSDNYSDVLIKNISLAASRTMKIEIKTQEETAKSQPSAQQAQISATSARTINERCNFQKSAAPAKILPSINPRNTFETFVVGEGNKFAHAAALAVAQNPGKAYNPLFIYGATGLGKTHLMHAIAHFVLKNRTDARIVYISSETFVNEYISALSSGNISSFRKLYRNTDVLLIDDVQFFAKKESCQEEFFHTFNELFNNGRQIILSCDKPLNEVSDITDRLVTRFGWGVSVDIQAPDYETRMAILQKKVAQLGKEIAISSDAIELVASRFTKNVRRMEGALNKLIGYASLIGNGSVITAEKAQDLLADALMVEDGNEQICIEQIQKKVAEYFKIDAAEILGKSRTANIAMARQIAMYMSRKLTTHSLEEIGRKFGGKKHGTVMHAIKVVDDNIHNDDNVKRAVEFLMKIFSV